ncbi:MAG: hypothetical protein OXE83_08805 [Gammaproteobacteria bacterium]|nr:hypothetical protein [Gammaproteobacteria bacterium]
MAAIMSWGCQVKTTQWKFFPDDGDAMIDLCLREYAGKTSRVLSDDADRANVYSRWDVSWVVFTRGEMGTFGEPEFGFTTYLRCAIATTPRLRVERMDEGTFSRIIDLEPKSYEDFQYLDEFPIASLYVRYGSDFFYTKSRRPHSRKEMAERIDRMIDRRNESRPIPEFMEIY